MRKTFYAVSVLVVLGGCAMPSPGDSEVLGESSAGLTANAVYQFKLPQLTNSCLDVNAASTADGAKIQEWGCNGTAAQNFIAESINGYWRFKNSNSNKCLDVTGGGTADGTDVIQWGCHTGTNQQWSEEAINGYKRYRGVASGKCLDVDGASSANGTVVQIWSCNGTGAQTWNPVGGGSCTPATCSSAGAQCGSIGDGCGGTLSCGSCSSGYTCSSNQCVSSGKKVVGYIPSWNSSTSIQYSKLTHINVAFAVPNASGGLTGPDNQAWLQNTVIPTAHNNGVKVCISVGGWMGDSPGAGTYDSAISGGNRTTLVNNIVGLVNNLGADCADIDYEYVGSDAASNFDGFITQLDGALGSGKLLTAAVAAFGGNADTFPASTFDNFDFINLMAYDIQNCQHSSYQNAVDSLNYWSNRGMPASKLVLGLPMYSHTCGGFGPVYKDLYNANAANACQDSDGTNYWNGIPTIRSKGELARSYAGIMFWELSQDHSSASLLTAGYEAVKSLSYSYNCSGGGGGNCGIYTHSQAGPCGWWTYSDCCDPCTDNSSTCHP